MIKINYIFRNQKIRLDKFLVEELSKEDLSRNQVEEIIAEGYVYINDSQVTKKSTILKEDCEILIKKDNFLKQDEIKLVAQKMDLDIVYEDDYFLIVNKKSGIVVHPSIGHPDNTLLNGIIYHTQGKILDLAANSEDTRPGVVHRLDKDTSGLIIFAKTFEVMRAFNKMILERNITKHYHALVTPKLEYDKGVIDAPIGRDAKNRQKMAVTDFNSKESSTYFEVEKRSENWELVKIELVTGRTHQIRVHFNFIKHPILNDPVYGKNIKEATSYGQYLIASELKFNHPITKQDMHFKIDLDQQFNSRMKKP